MSIINAIKRNFILFIVITTSCLSYAQGGSDQLIIKYKDSVNQAQITNQLASANAIASAYGVSLKKKRNLFNGATVVSMGKKLSKGTLKALIKSLSDNNPSIEYVEEDALMTINMVPNDSLYNEQWDLFEPQGGINVETAWDMSSGSGVNVAVVDTGYRPHADLVDNILPGYDFISSTSVSNDGDGRDSDATDPGDGCGAKSSWHGTHVAGTIAAKANNGTGVAGIAFNAKVVPVRVLGCGGGYTSDIADGVVWAAGGSVSGVPNNSNPASVINMSLGGDGACSSTMQNAINSARTHNAVVVVAAGNDNDNAANHHPANCSGVITVAAVDRTGGKAWYSNYGSTVEIAAPGGDTSSNSANGILSTLNAGYSTPGADSYAFYQGTSMAAPHVAGVAALMKSVEPRLTSDQILQAMQDTARAFPNTCTGCGAGILRADQAVYASLFKLVPLYRYWNSDKGDHFFTIDRNDAGYAYFGYSFEQIEAYVSSHPKTNFIPLYRYWNSSVGDHFYTTTRNDSGYAAYGYSYEKIEGYVKSNSNNGFVPLHRYWNGTIKDHFYTPVRNDAGYGAFGYSYENIEGYVRDHM